MRKSKLFTLLRALSKKEFRQLEKYLQSPYFNTNEQLCQFWAFLEPYQPEFRHENLQKKQLFEFLFPGQVYNDGKVRKLMTAMSSTVEDFLLQEHLKKRDGLKWTLRQELFGMRNLYKYFERETEKIIEHYEQKNYRDIDDHLMQWHTRKNYFFHPDTNRYGANEADLRQMLNSLDVFFVLSKLKVSGEMRSRERVLNRQYDIWMLEEVKSQADAIAALKDHTIFNLYRDVLELQEGKSDMVFDKIKQQLYLHHAHFTSDVAQFCLHHLLNYAIWKTNQGKLEYLPQVFNLYQFGLDTRLLIYQQRITDTTFTNIAAIGIRNEAFEWVEHFIENYQEYLDQKIRSSVCTLCYGFLHYSRHELDKAIELLIDFDFSNDYYYLRAKTLLLRSLYEQFVKDPSLYHVLIAQSKAYEKFLRRNKTIGEYQVEVHLNFVKMLRQMVKIRYQQRWEDKAHQKLWEKMNQMQQLANKDWLLMQMGN